MAACIPGLPAQCEVECSLAAVLVPTASVAAEIAPTTLGAVTVIPASGLFVAETGTTAGFTVVLDNAPTATVTLPINSADTSEVAVAPASLSFTTANWNFAQTITLTGVDDALLDGNQVVTIVVGSAVSTDPNYNGLDPADVSVTNTDDDVANVVIAESAASTAVAEGGATDSYTVVLTQNPTAAVNITVTASAQASANGSFTTTVLNFTSGGCPGPGNWCTAQTVTVAAADDAAVEGTHNAAFSHTVASGDAAYNGLAVSNVTAAITDNDRFTFRTAATHNGDFDNDAALGGNGDGFGIAEADSFCMADTNRPNTSTYKALLVNPVAALFRRGSQTANAGDGQIDWVLTPNTSYYRRDGTTALFTTNPNSIFVFGTMTNSFEASAGNYWSSLRNDWRTGPVQSCASWSESTGNARVGDALATDGSALRLTGPPTACSAASQLICIEQ